MAITKLMSIKSRPGAKPSKGLASTLKYITNPDKTDNGMWVRSHNTFPEWKGAYNDMLLTKKMWKQEEGMQGYHFVISFPPSDNVSPELALDITEQFLNKFLGDDYEALYSAHTDHNHMHTHIVFNSVSKTNGKKYHYAFGDWRKIIQPIVNDLCLQYGLQTIDLNVYKDVEEVIEADILRMALTSGKRLNHAEWEEEKRQHKTWADFIAADIDRVLPDCKSFEEVVSALMDIGWSVKWKTKDGSRVLKHYSVKPPFDMNDKKRAWLRPDVRCGYGYSREGIEQRIKLGLFIITDIDIGAQYKINVAPKIIWSGFPEYYEKPVLTAYQKKYIAMLYRTGLMAKRSASVIPKEYRANVCDLSQLQKVVNYVLTNRIDGEKALMNKISELRTSLVLGGKNVEKKDRKRVEREIEFCEQIDRMSKTTNNIGSGDLGLIP